MKTMLKLFITSLVVLLVASVAAIAQDTIIVPDPIGPNGTIQDFLNLYNGLESAIIILAGYLHNWIPGINMIKSKWLRVILIGAVVAVIFGALGLNNGIGTALVFLQSVGFYEIILKKVKSSPPVATKS